MKVFISYIREDFEIAKSIYDHLLKLSGLEVFMDREKIKPGAKWEKDISNEIESSTFAIVIISKRFNEKNGWIKKEIKMLLEKYRKENSTFKIIPLRTDQSLPKNRELKKINCIDLYQYLSFESGMKSLESVFGFKAGSVQIINFPPGILPESFQVGNYRWNSDQFKIDAGKYKVKLLNDELFFEKEIEVKHGEITIVDTEGIQCLEPDIQESRYAVNRKSDDELVVRVVYDGYHLHEKAGKVAWIVHKKLGFPLYYRPWNFYKERGDGALRRFSAVNKIFYGKINEETALLLQREFYNMKPKLFFDITDSGPGKASDNIGYGNEVKTNWGGDPRYIFICIVD